MSTALQITTYRDPRFTHLRTLGYAVGRWDAAMREIRPLKRFPFRSVHEGLTLTHQRETWRKANAWMRRAERGGPHAEYARQESTT